MPFPKYINNYPMNRKTYWSDKLQGVTHSEDHWFFTQLTKLHKFPVGSDLNRSGYPQNAAHVDMPNSLSSARYNHFGDPEYIKIRDRGYIFIPVEGNGIDPVSAVFRDDAQMSYAGSAPLPSQTIAKGIGRAGWVAFDPINHILHSSHNRISADYPVYRYAVDFDQIENNNIVLTPLNSLVLTDANGRPISIGKYIQGGCFSPDSTFFICNGKQGDKSKGGIRAFTSTGMFLYKSVVRATDTNHFVYAYNSDRRHNEEPEGITFWDVDSLGAPNIAGQLHGILLDNDPGTDKLYFKHYRIESS